jgi:hypothetical protein
MKKALNFYQNSTKEKSNQLEASIFDENIFFGGELHSTSSTIASVPAKTIAHFLRSFLSLNSSALP